MRSELLPERHRWHRVADPTWADPLDPDFAADDGGRWNPPGSFAVLYLNQDLVTARLNVRLFALEWPYAPEDLREENAPVLLSVTLPRQQRVLDAHSPAGVAEVGLPASYPEDSSGTLVTHRTCQGIGEAAHAAGLRGVRCRSARSPLGAGRELAWFPATVRSRARLVHRASFSEWFYA